VELEAEEECAAKGNLSLVGFKKNIPRKILSNLEQARESKKIGALVDGGSFLGWQENFSRLLEKIRVAMMGRHCL